MSSADRFKSYAPDTQAVVRLEEALPPEHPVHVFIDLVRSVDLGHFVVPPGPKGEKPYHHHALFGILAWGYLHGVRSARKLARLARQEATFVYLAGGGRPNYRTLARFRRENGAAFTAVFQETVILALRVGLARLGHVALDGTKRKANTSKHKAMSYGRMRQREAQLKEGDRPADGAGRGAGCRRGSGVRGRLGWLLGRRRAGPARGPLGEDPGRS
jgi:transposase